MVRSLGQLGEEPAKRQKRRYVPAPPRSCYLCDRELTRGMGVEDRMGFKCRRPCSWLPAVTSDDSVP